MALPIGTILDGKFKIVQILGEGGMGTVYKVEQVGTTPPYYYAVKELLISPNTSEEDRKAAIERFNKEIALLRGLKHPRIAALMLPFQDRGNYYFAMEFVPGRSLEKILENSNGPLPEEQTVKWMIQVCEALSYIHSRNPPIILRDLKPGNIMITPDNEVQLIDFGIARRFDPNKRTNTENLGTISYASPEHLGSITSPGQRRTAQNPGKLVQTDARSDIYSLGATMYHLLTNYEPDPIQTPAPGSILAKNPRLHTVKAGNKNLCPVEQVIIKAMQQAPEQRFQSAEAMRVALQHCLPNSVAPTTIQIPALSPAATILVANRPGVGLVCPKCGLQNRPGAKFCQRDGQPLVQGVAVAPPQVRVPPARSSIQARPVQPIRPRPIQARPVQSIQARPAQPIQARPVQPIQARPVSAPATVNDGSAAYRLGLQNLANKNYVEAVNQFKLVLQQRGPYYDVLYNLGRAYRQYGQSTKETDKRLFSENLKFAAERFEEATRYKADALDAYFQLGMCYRDLSLYAQATNAFKQAQSLAPQDSAIYYQLGLLAMEQGNYRDAEAYFLDGLRINPDHALILIAIGRLYIDTKQTSSAISTLRQATQRDPALWEGWYELGRAHMKAREWKMALSALEEARKAGPHAPEIYSAMATCYLKMNKKVEARHMVHETLQRDPKNAEALRLQKQL
ncbi:tetratricopeptide repeat protein [Ktedonosporobacter rubrisoli]|uniref:Tetratricopeptide repeat protein n=1 Tax=Ktedonosporobacter rubrisoli TaxID=2509675 RepID=A0A4P6JYA2_KTERU|nr:protein kinase [Ktedonosporobacter rubrisoli]QBD80674.1 tetratricopeptide repeat protein [Ktedonosporobacter rubrisoli]